MISERDKGFGNFPKTVRLVNGRAGRRKFFGGFQKGVQEPGWSWGHRKQKKTPDPATGPVHRSRVAGTGFTGLCLTVS